MKNKFNLKNVINNLALIAVLLFGVNQLTIIKLTSSARAFGSVGSNIQLRDNAGEAEVIKAILPKDSDTVRPYQWEGQPVTLSARVPNNGYDKLVAMNKVQLTTEETKSRFTNLTKNIYHPCCDAPLASCGCKHSVAAKGLVKYLLNEGYDDEQIKGEVFMWNRYWWPRHYATAAVYLNSQGTNPAEISMTDWLGSNLSTIRSGRKLRALLRR